MFLVDMRSFSNISHPDPPCARRPTRVLRPKPQTLLFCASIGSWLDQDTPFGRLAKRVFFGDSDAFRDERLKLIPKVSAASVTTTVAVAVALSPVIWRGKPLPKRGAFVFFSSCFFLEVLVSSCGPRMHRTRAMYVLVAIPSGELPA